MKNDYGWDRLRLTDQEKEELWERIGPHTRRRWWERILPSPPGSGRRWLPLRPVPAFIGGAVALTLAALVVGQFTTHGRRPGADLLQTDRSAVTQVPRPAAPLVEPGMKPQPRATSPGLAAPPVAPAPERPRADVAGRPQAAAGGVTASNAPAPSEQAETGTPHDVGQLEPVTVESGAYMVDAGKSALTKYAIDSVEDARNKHAGIEVGPTRHLPLGSPAPARGDPAGSAGGVRAGGADRYTQAVRREMAAPASPREQARDRDAEYEPSLAAREAMAARERERLAYENEFRRRCWIPPDPRFDMMYFQHTGINPFVRTEADALSTFGLDVDNASYTVTRAYLDRGQLPPEAAVRVEEFVNFFKQDYPSADKDDFRMVVDGAPSPFHEGYYLVRVGLRARDVRPADRKPASITLVIDVSGSMADGNRLELVKRAVRVLLDRLDPSDTVGIVTYTTYARVALEPTRASRRELIESVLDELSPQQSTNVDEGLQFGYRMARGSYRPGAINRIVLCTDGVANEGIVSPEGILDHVRREADAGIHLTAIGVGMGNYNDTLLEKLADKGDGNYYYVDSMEEARRVFGERLTGTLQTVAKDAKVQVEFDPDAVSRWRLLGYEKRAIADRDFRNDAVDAGEIGAGHQVTALYEIRLADRVERRDRDRVHDSSTYRDVQRVAERLGVVRLRYREPESEGRAAGLVREQERRFSFDDLSRSFGSAPRRLRLDAAAAEFAEILRGSYWARGDELQDVARIADDVAGELRGDNDVQDFAGLVKRAASLRGQHADPQR